MQNSETAHLLVGKVHYSQKLSKLVDACRSYSNLAGRTFFGGKMLYIRITGQYKDRYVFASETDAPFFHVVSSQVQQSKMIKLLN